MIHHKCRNNVYPDRTKEIQRLHVPDDKVKWEIEWSMYQPPEYTSERIKGQVWADPDIADSAFQPSWNSLDGNVNRVSYVKTYETENGYPVNPVGRTGLRGRGILGRWGPNHAADPIVTRWKRSSIGRDVEHDAQSSKPVLQFVAIQRRDSGEWAIPGGMVDPGEQVSVTVKREFMEEALCFLDKSEDEKAQLKAHIENTFKNGAEVYKGYVDDPRNTDNAWMETVAFLFHDEENESVGSLPLHAGDDAVGVQWMDVSGGLKLYASHVSLLEQVAKNLKAHW